MTLSVIVATIGRPTLARTLASFAPQAWKPGDELLVLSDANHTEVDRLCAASGVSCIRRIAAPDGPLGSYGHGLRNRYMAEAKGDYLCHFDDDDVALPTMVRDMKSVLGQVPTLHLFRMLSYKTKRKVWKQKQILKRGAVSTQNFLHPNIPATFGTWRMGYGGDFDFGQQTARKVGRVEWWDCTTAVYGPPAHLDLKQVLTWYAATTRRG